MTQPERVSLREQMGAKPDPDFVLALPDGWARHTPTEELEAQWIRRASQKMMQQHRPDLDVQVRSMIRASFQQMRKERVLAFFAPDEESEDTLWLPLSLVASVRSTSGGVSLDDMVRHAIRNYDAKPLMGDMRIIRFERETVREQQGQPINQITVQYIIPVPGSRRQRALQLFASLVRPDGVDSFADHLAASRMLLDSIVASIQWVEPKSAFGAAR
ncbi:hypothetical protein [Agrococcus casei]|uniref:hypothetical protein n=1 Tax=Agrococcus casei TaxID=343512 RepID=UPI003F8DC6B9